MFLSGKQFDTSTALWTDFLEAKRLRDEWTHPKPPFNTWGLTLEKVEKAVKTLIEVVAELHDIDRELDILALRDRARERLGARFDLRAFHDVVLGAGALPLPLLRERVESWTPTLVR